MLQSGDHEGLKGSVHAGLGLLALVCLGYNALALLARREPHLACNLVVYTALVSFEVHKTSHHWRTHAVELGTGDQGA